jgi:hypothetical protein
MIASATAITSMTACRQIAGITDNAPQDLTLHRGRAGDPVREQRCVVSHFQHWWQ